MFSHTISYNTWENYIVGKKKKIDVDFYMDVSVGSCLESINVVLK